MHLIPLLFQTICFFNCIPLCLNKSLFSFSSCTIQKYALVIFISRNAAKMFEKHEKLKPSKKLLHHIIIYPFILHLLNFPYHSTSSFRHRLYFSPFTSHFRLESSIFPPFFKIRISKFTRNFRKILYTYRHLYLSMGENVHKTRYRIKNSFSLQ